MSVKKIVRCKKSKAELVLSFRLLVNGRLEISKPERSGLLKALVDSTPLADNLTVSLRGPLPLQVDQVSDPSRSAQKENSQMV